MAFGKGLVGRKTKGGSNALKITKLVPILLKESVGPCKKAPIYLLLLNYKKIRTKARTGLSELRTARIRRPPRRLARRRALRAGGRALRARTGGRALRARTADISRGDFGILGHPKS